MPESAGCTTTATCRKQGRQSSVSLSVPCCDKLLCVSTPLSDCSHVDVWDQHRSHLRNTPTHARKVHVPAAWATHTVYPLHTHTPSVLPNPSNYTGGGGVQQQDPGHRVRVCQEKAATPHPHTHTPRQYHCSGCLSFCSRPTHMHSISRALTGLFTVWYCSPPPPTHTGGGGVQQQDPGH